MNQEIPEEFWDQDKVICPECCEFVDIEDMIVWNGAPMCQDCAEDYARAEDNPEK